MTVIWNPQGPLLDYTPTNAPQFGAFIKSCVVGRASWWVDTPVPFANDSIDDETHFPTAGSILSLSRGAAQIKWSWEIKEYWNEGGTIPAEVYIIKDMFSISGKLLTIAGPAGESLMQVLSGGRSANGVIANTQSGFYNRRPFTIIAENLNPKATGKRLLICSIYSGYCDGLSFDIATNQLSEVSVTIKAAKPGIAPGLGIGRVVAL